MREELVIILIIMLITAHDGFDINPLKKPNKIFHDYFRQLTALASGKRSTLKNFYKMLKNEFKTIYKTSLIFNL